MIRPDQRTIRTRAERPPMAERRERQRRTTMRKEAAELGIRLSQTVVIGSCVIGLDPRGNLHRWMGGRWVQLEPVSVGMRRAARVAAGVMASIEGASL